MGTTRNPELESRLDAYSATLRSSSKAALRHAVENWQVYATVAASALATATSAAAQVTYSGPQNLTASVSSVGRLSTVQGSRTPHRSTKFVSLKPGIGFRIGVSQGIGDGFLDGAAYVGAFGGLEFLGVGSAGLELQNLGSHVKVSTAGVFRQNRELFLNTRHQSSYGGGTYGLWNAGKTSFAGFEFKTNTTNPGAQTDYGWVRLVYTVSANQEPNSITAIDWEYGPSVTTNVPSTATPEPSTAALALLAAGAAGVAALGRRRKSAAV